jgi:hypothetical protein
VTLFVESTNLPVYQYTSKSFSTLKAILNVLCEAFSLDSFHWTLFSPHV